MVETTLPKDTMPLAAPENLFANIESNISSYGIKEYYNIAEPSLLEADGQRHAL